MFLGLFGRVVCRIMGLPAPGKAVPVRVDFTPNNDRVTWDRHFAARRYSSDFSIGSGRRAGMLIETMGPIEAVFAVQVQTDRLRYEIVGGALLGVPLPRALAPKCVASESEQAGSFRFDIEIGLPWFGRLIVYSGVIG